MKTRFNLSQIMKQAWQMFRCTFFHYTSFAEALKAAWYSAKKEFATKARTEQIRKEVESMTIPSSTDNHSKFYNRFSKRISKTYQNVTFGRNDWAVDFRL